MKLAFSKPTADAAEQEQLFSAFRAAGYDGLQLKASQYRDVIETPELFLEQHADAPGAASALIVGGKLDDADVAALRRVFRFAQAVGSDLVVFCHAVPRPGLTSDDIRGFAGPLSRLGKEAQELGIKLSLHHHYNQPVMYREDFDVFFDAVEDQSVGLTVDTAHLVKSGIDDIAGLIRDFSHVIDNFHLKDFADGDWKVLGQGRIDFTPVFEAIREIQFGSWISADEESGSDLPGAMKTCYSFMQSGLSTARGYASSRA